MATATRLQKKRWNEEKARDHLKAWRDSGLSMAEYARRHDVPVWRLRWWKEKLERAGTKELSSKRRPAGGSSEKSKHRSGQRKRKGDVCGDQEDRGSARDFVEVCSSSLTISGTTELALYAPGGYRVAVPVGFDAPTLRRMLSVLQEVM